MLVLGIGNEMLGDDAVGVRIAEDLAARESEAFLAIPVGVSVENAAHLVGRHRADVVILVDAALGRWREGWGFIPPRRLDSFCHSTHSIPLSLFVKIWKDENPKLVVLFIGVQPVTNSFASGLSPAVERARREIVAVFERELWIAAHDRLGGASRQRGDAAFRGFARNGRARHERSAARQSSRAKRRSSPRASRR